MGERITLHKERMCNNDRGCSWCGQHKTDKKGWEYLYRYWQEGASGRKSPIKGLFCSKSCLDAYNA
jgi:hypothetical protein